MRVVGVVVEFDTGTRQVVPLATAMSERPIGITDASYGCISDRGGVIHINGEVVEMRAQQYDILRLLIEAQGRVVRRQELEDMCWPDNYEVSRQALDAMVKRIREKLVPHGVNIVTARGRGFYLEA